MTQGFVIGATGSGTGKTTLSLAMMASLKARGLAVAPFKVGPDFIDPGLHAKLSGAVSYNLDSWMLPAEYNLRLFRDKSKGRDIAVVEGVMGLFDGYDALTETGSTAQMAKLLNLPVVLVVSAKGKARSAAAIVKGFETFDPDLSLAGVIFTQAGSERHYHYIRDAVEQNCTTPCLGYMPKNEAIVMPERHLGLVTADEMPISQESVSILVSMIEDHVDLDRLLDSLEEINSRPLGQTGQRPLAEPGSGLQKKARIAVARDKAFCFYYPDNLDILAASGAELVYFSPLEADSLPENIDGIYFGGGYPELNAEKLAAKQGLLNEIHQASESGMPIYGECGGFMYLCRAVSGMSGSETFDMCGVFDFSIRMSGRLRSLGYREITLSADTLLGRKGDQIRGHEFHYSSLENADMAAHENVYQVASRAGQAISLKGFQKRKTLGSYLHVHFGSNPEAARHFVDHCAGYKNKRTGRQNTQNPEPGQQTDG